MCEPSPTSGEPGSAQASLLPEWWWHPPCANPAREGRIQADRSPLICSRYSRNQQLTSPNVVKFEACGPVAQLDRASDFGSEGWGFDSLRGRHFSRSAPLSIQDIRVFLAIQSSCPWGTSTKSDFNRTSANLVPAPVEVNLSRPVAIPTALKARCIRTFR